MCHCESSPPDAAIYINFDDSGNPIMDQLYRRGKFLQSTRSKKGDCVLTWNLARDSAGKISGLHFVGEIKGESYEIGARVTMQQWHVFRPQPAQEGVHIWVDVEPVSGFGFWHGDEVREAFREFRRIYLGTSATLGREPFADEKLNEIVREAHDEAEAEFAHYGERWAQVPENVKAFLGAFGLRWFPFPDGSFSTSPIGSDPDAALRTLRVENGCLPLLNKEVGEKVVETADALSERVHKGIEVLDMGSEKFPCWWHDDGLQASFVVRYDDDDSHYEGVDIVIEGWD